jgi:predicted DNA-binding mobile mystery protein A
MKTVFDPVIMSLRRVVETRVRPFRALMSRADAPGGSWICAIREALAMPPQVAARRAGLTRQSLLALEQSERDGTVSLNTLRKAAEALDAELVYAIVPRKSLRAIVEERARAKAQISVDRVTHSMALEKQRPSEEAQRDLVKARSTAVLTGSSARLWEDD